MGHLIMHTFWISLLSASSTLQMFTGVHRVIKGFFYNICRDLSAICKYYRFFFYLKYSLEKNPQKQPLHTVS